MPRFVAIHLSGVRVALARASAPGASREDDAGLAVVIARPGGAVQRETDLLGNTPLDEVSDAARARGVRAGETLAAARAKSAELRVCVVQQGAIEGALAAVAEAALAFGATVGFDPAADIVWVDITGCAHLHGPCEEEGERALARRLARRVRQMGWACRLAIAGGPRIAAAVAMHAPRGQRGPLRVPLGRDARAMQSLPIEALPLDAEALTWLSNVGMRTVGQLAKLPPAGLGTRLGAREAEVMQLVRGEDRAPLTPYRPPAVPEERVELEDGISAREALLFVVKILCDRMHERLRGRAMAAAQIELVLALDRLVLRENPAPTGVMTIALALPVPLSRAPELLAALRARIEAASFALPGPVVAIGLRVPSLVVAPARPRDLFLPEAKATAALPRLLAELSLQLGPHAVGRLELGDSWVPEERSRMGVVSSASGHEARARRSSPEDPGSAPLRGSAVEPTRVLPQPSSCDLSRLRVLSLLARDEAVEWWRRGLTAHDRLAVWLRAEDAEGVAWVEQSRPLGEAGGGSVPPIAESSRGTWVRGWLD